MKPSQWIDATDRLKLETAAQSLREETGTEITIAIVANSCWNPQIPWRIATCFAALTLLTAPLYPTLYDPNLLSIAVPLVFLAGFGIGHIPRIQRNLQNSKSVCAKVNCRAQRIFSEAGLTRTKAQRGILFFISLLEERVVVLADAGVASRDSNTNQCLQLSSLIAEGFRSGKPTPSLLTAIARCSEILPPAPSTMTPSEHQNNCVLLVDSSVS